MDKVQGSETNRARVGARVAFKRILVFAVVLGLVAVVVGWYLQRGNAQTAAFRTPGLGQGFP